MEKSLAHNEKRLLNTLKKRAESAFLKGNYEESLKGKNLILQERSVVEFFFWATSSQK